jgi:hypothetical protein
VAVGPSDHDILEGGELQKRLDQLEGPGDARARQPVPGKPGHIFAIEQHLSRVGLEEPGDQVQRGGLA